MISIAMKYYDDNVIIETLTDNELDALIINMHMLDHGISELESIILNDAEVELASRNDTIIVAGWDEETELEDWA
jgi:hypothetical protein